MTGIKDKEKEEPVGVGSVFGDTKSRGGNADEKNVFTGIDGIMFSGACGL